MDVLSLGLRPGTVAVFIPNTRLVLACLCRCLRALRSGLGRVAAETVCGWDVSEMLLSRANDVLNLMDGGVCLCCPPCSIR